MRQSVISADIRATDMEAPRLIGTDFRRSEALLCTNRDPYQAAGDRDAQRPVTHANCVGDGARRGIDTRDGAVTAVCDPDGVSGDREGNWICADRDASHDRVRLGPDA